MGSKRITEKDLVKVANKAIKDFKGHIPDLENAIGMLTVGRQLGWKPLYLIHSKSTIRKYEHILGVRLRDVLPEAGPKAEKSYAYIMSVGVSNFWKAVSGEIRDIRSAWTYNPDEKKEEKP